jgi:hypothetical protein
MDLSSLTNRAKDLFNKRGGSQALKEDAQELKDISRGEGSASEKAKEAFEAIKDPGKPGEEGAAPTRQE